MKALLVIDLQNGVCKIDGGIYDFDNMVSRVNGRIKQYRDCGDLIVFVQHNDEDLIDGNDAWQFVDELDVHDDDLRVQKTHPDSFYKTDLAAVLKAHDIDALEICGAQTEYCVDTTIRVGHHLGYQLSMMHGTATTFDNQYLKADQMLSYYECLWNQRFLTFINK